MKNYRLNNQPFKITVYLFSFKQKVRRSRAQNNWLHKRDDGDGIDRVKRKVLFISKEYICLAYRGPPTGTKELLHSCFEAVHLWLNNEGYLFMCLREMLPVWRHAASGTALLMERRRPPADRRPAL